MKKALYITLMLPALLTCSVSVKAYKTPDKSSGASSADKSLTAGCLPPSASAVLDLNNVRTLIHSGGDMWWDLKQFGRYEIPKGQGKHSLYVGTLWIGGTDVNGQLKIAAQRYRTNGVDYYTGPLSDSTAEISSETCKAYDKIWKITRAEVELHRLCKVVDPNNSKCKGYSTPTSITDWPATTFRLNTFPSALGSKQYQQAPFVDVDGDGVYDPESGDYPGYDLDKQIDCKKNRSPYLRGDVTLFWVFNDKGNIHNETQSTPIGMEVRGQAFAFATNDEINNMTFYNYELINRGTTTLFNCYFGVNTDADIGFAFDDYTGCDVRRGFGYMYNGKDIDGTGAPDHYGKFPPAIGIDFFEGPYMDPNGKADVFDSSDVSTWLAINGIGFNDTIVDNERIGMRRFVYYNNAAGVQSDPTLGVHYYNFLRGFWKNNSRMVFGGTGITGSQSATTIEADFMFPGDSDPIHWGTKGVNPGFDWYDRAPGPGLNQNPPGDRRFVQSSGSFTLLPGAVNDITTGAVWARTTNGTPFESVQLVRKADDKAQLLFENCFRIVDGPDAPDVAVQELDREILLYWTNSQISNNYLNKYQEVDFAIDTTLIENGVTIPVPVEKRKYKFQGYLIYQVANAQVTPDERLDPDKSRLLAQCDIKDFDATGNPIGRLINYNFDQDLGISIPELEVEGANTGVFQSLRVVRDLFATGPDDRLVNNRPYYYLVLAYAYNDFKRFDPNDPLALDGQKKPFLLGRKSATGPIQVYTAIPHITSPEAYGTVLNSYYGDSPEITRIEGNGNGGNALDFLPEVEAQLLNAPYFVEQPTYQRAAGPLSIKVIDPLSLSKGNYIVKLLPDSTPVISGVTTLWTNTKWIMYDETGDTIAISDEDLTTGTEQILFNRKNGEPLGLSMAVRQANQPGFDRESNNGLINASMSFSGSQGWLGFIPDVDAFYKLNWILSGTVTQPEPPNEADYVSSAGVSYDKDQIYERISFFNGGGVVPYRLTSTRSYAPGFNDPLVLSLNRMDNIQSVDIVLTPDKSKWSRCPVFELDSTNTRTVYTHPELASVQPKKLDMRRSPSVDKNGRYATEDGTITGKLLQGSSNNPEDANYMSNWGMGWFPGYAVSLETGERLNIAFGEDSYLTQANGRDMLFNPLSFNLEFPANNPSVISEFGDAILGGKHFIYVFASQKQESASITEMPRYDNGAKFIEYMGNATVAPTANQKRSVWRAAMWTGMPMAILGQPWLANEARIRLRVSKPYTKFQDYQNTAIATPQNDNNPMYKFSLDGLAPVTGNRATADAALDLINVVPNPYYSYASYENNKLDTRVRITNLPPECTISIYNTAGTLIRRYTKADNTTTAQDWDLRNFANIPIASGIYIIHVRVPGVGDRILKWFGVMRPVDLTGL